MARLSSTRLRNSSTRPASTEHCLDGPCDAGHARRDPSTWTRSRKGEKVAKACAKPKEQRLLARDLSTPSGGIRGLREGVEGQLSEKAGGAFSLLIGREQGGTSGAKA